jgi:hypothetical protein
VDVVDLFMALLSFVESAPRAYRLKASNAAPPFSTSAGTSADRMAYMRRTHSVGLAATFCGRFLSVHEASNGHCISSKVGRQYLHTIGAHVDDLVDPEPVTEIRHLHHRRETSNAIAPPP